MTNQNLVDVIIDELERFAFKALQQQTVSAVLLALGSNSAADRYLPLMRHRLKKLGDIKLSTAFQNPDFTATTEQPKPDYTNQCVYLRLKKPVTLSELQRLFRTFEAECGRARFTDVQPSLRLVTMDIDILLIETARHKNSLSNFIESKWVIIADRYPFKVHEITGINELAFKVFEKSLND